MAIENHKLTPVLVGIHLVALPLYPRIPAYILLLIVMFTLWTVFIISGRTSQPKKIIRILLVGIIVFSLMVSYGSIFGQGPGTSMLLMLSFLKLFENLFISNYTSKFLVSNRFLCFCSLFC